uniref:Uncharacterized protein n=1 Tax=Noctiluca scintillans TaxID=2966 RepID=A0A7S1F3P4_NOCSC
MPQLWKIVGGADKGGILVRDGESISSKQITERLSTGALVEEAELRGQRLSYRRMTGAGPARGWISILASGKNLAVRVSEPSVDSSFAAPLAPAAAHELPPHITCALASGVPRKLRPSTEVAAGLRPPTKRLGPLMPTENRKEFFQRAARRLRGDIFGLLFPATPEEFVTEEFGARWLTDAFHRAGTLPADNRVVRITWWRRFEGGGSGPKTLFTVEYEKPDETLDTRLFMKQPYTIEENKTQRFIEEGQCRFGDVHGGEITFYQWISPHVPFSVPKYYFGDQNRESTESCLINAAMDWPETGSTASAYDLLPPCAKCEDWRLPDSHEYYFALMRRLGMLAGLEKAGHLGPDVRGLPWTPYQHFDAKREPGLALHLKQFVEEVSPQIWAERVRSKKFWTQFEGAMDLVAKCSNDIGKYQYDNPLYVGFGHANGNTDNAYFFRDQDGRMDCGLLDWGQTGFMPYADEFQNSFASSLGEMLAEYDDRLIQAFADAYHEAGGPNLDVEELILRWRLSFASGLQAMLPMVIPFLSEKHPQGRSFWKGIRAYNDDAIISNFTLNFGVSMLYNRVVLWSLRGETYLASIEAWSREH